MQSVPDAERYAVVVCPTCHHAKGVDRTAKTTTCGRCNSRHEVDKLRVLCKTGNADELRHAVGVVEAKVTGGDAALIDVRELQQEIEARSGASRTRPASGGEDTELVQYAASRAAGVESVAKKAGRILDALNEARPDGFTQENVEDAFEAAGLPRGRAEKEIRRGLVVDELFEPRPGRLKRLV